MGLIYIRGDVAVAVARRSRWEIDASLREGEGLQ